MIETNRPQQPLQFKFVCGLIPGENIVMHEFSGTERLSGLYDFEIRFSLRKKFVPPALFIKLPAMLLIIGKNFIRPVSGIITTCAYSTATGWYRARLRPALYCATLTKQCRIFQKLSIPDIVKKILSEQKIPVLFSMNVKPGAYPVREYCVQFNETDLDFVARLLEENGIWYFFRHPELPEKSTPGAPIPEHLVITDLPAMFLPPAGNPVLLYRTRSGLDTAIEGNRIDYAYELQKKVRAVPRQVVMKGYSYSTPEIDLLSTKTIPGGIDGEYYTYGGNFSTVLDVEKAATDCAMRFGVAKVSVAGKSNCFRLQPGCQMAITEHPRFELNQSYIFTEITHYGRCTHSVKEKIEYGNEFKGFPATNVWMYRPDITIKKPLLPTFITAKIEAYGKEYATLDDKGRYKVRMPFDLEPGPPCSGSNYLRMSQLYSGSDYGVHFPNHQDAEMVIAHVNGDPDCPIGIATIPNGNTISPVTSGNKHQSIIRTAAKNEICMDDSDKKELFTIKTPGNLNVAAKHDSAETAGNDRVIEVKGDEKRTVNKEQALTVSGNKKVTVEGDASITNKKNLTDTYKDDATFSVAGDSTINVSGTSKETLSGDRTLKVTGKNNEKITGKNTVSVDGKTTVTVTGNCTVKSMKQFAATAETSVTIRGADVTIKADRILKVKSNESEVSIDGEGCSLAAPLITSTAAMIKADAITDHVITGLILKLN